MKEKIDILFILPSLRSGGAERVMSFLAQNIDPTTFKASLLITGSNEDQKYQVDKIDVTFLNKKRVKQAIPAIIKYLLVNRPKIVISAIGHLNMAMGLIGLLFPKIKFVARETTISGFSLNTENKGNKKGSKFYRFSLRSVDKIICQSNDMKNALIGNHGISVSKIIVINNPVTSKFKLKSKPSIKDNELKFVTIGRLTERKGYERILNVLAKFKKPFHYTIIGSGNHKDIIVKTIEELGLGEKVTLISFTDKVNDILAENDLYLQGSYVEGFPNALLESCATGTPAVVYDAPGGINEIIIPGLNGYIAQDPTDFLEKLELSVCQDWSPTDIRESVHSRYSEQKIVSDYEEFFLDIVKKKNPCSVS